ncbi:spore coat protein SA [Alicyclobacillus contaminans]|uniref:glycosyltransferase family 4 protein n=1 Tax=Alicyclobacillus contaminans TaxID=392016 RepID=UPI0004065F03|nr:glycosyltransferase family 4 protein [Alicyclobacillus contaminans]GMA49521.1 spore coat protein SA [Alicyclobacillus contaminans]
MQIALIAPDDLPIPASRGGSVQIYLQSLADELIRRNVRIALYSPGRTPLGQHHTVISKRGQAYRRAVMRHLRRQQPDIVQVENRPSWVPAIRRMVPHAKIVLNLHSTTFLGPRHISVRQARAVLKSVDAVVTNSRYLQREIRRRFHLSNRDWRAAVIHPGVSLDAFTAMERRKEADPPFRILFVGRVIRQKGVHVLVEAVRQLVKMKIPVRATIIGGTHPWERQYRKRLEQRTRRLPIQWIGFVSPSDLPEWFADADVLVCPSQWDEAFGLVNVEALAAGVPVVASRVGGIPEVITSECGVLIRDYRRPEAFAEVFRTLAEHREHLQHLADQTRNRAEQFTWRRTGRAFERLYRELGLTC